jgi:uncharacterized protein (DUF952 family)
MTADLPSIIYKITTASLWEDAESTGHLRGMPIDEADGFMHFSTAAQLRETLKLHFKGQKDLVVLGVPTQNVADDLRWEPSRGGDLFPHLYGKLLTSHVTVATPVNVDAAGHADLTDVK